MPAVEQTLTTRPQPRSAIAGAAARIARSGAITLSSQAACQSSSGTSSRSRQLGGAGVVDEHVEGAEALVGCGEHPLAGVRGGDVERRGCLARPPVAAPARAAPRRRRQAALVARDQQHVGALGAEQPRGLASDPAAGAGDDAGRARQPEVHQSRPRPGSVDRRPRSRRPAPGAPGTCRRSRSSRSPLLVVELRRAARSVTANERGRRAVVLDVDVHLDRAEVPALALRVHLDRDRGAAGEAGGERARVGEGPVSLPPPSAGSSIDQACGRPRSRRRGRSPSRRRATTSPGSHRCIVAPCRGPRTAAGRRRRRSGPSRRRGRRRG